jgi:hypothetical protein
MERASQRSCEAPESSNPAGVFPVCRQAPLPWAGLTPRHGAPYIRVMTSEDKQQAHWQKAKWAVLNHALEKGGIASLQDLHNYAESNWFIAHQKFSWLMEECVAEELVTFAEGEFTITPKGRDFTANP